MVGWSDYELRDLLATDSSASGDRFMNCMTVFPAYLVAGCLLAARLNRAARMLFHRALAMNPGA